MGCCWRLCGVTPRVWCRESASVTKQFPVSWVMHVVSSRVPGAMVSCAKPFCTFRAVSPRMSLETAYMSIALCY